VLTADWKQVFAALQSVIARHLSSALSTLSLWALGIWLSSWLVCALQVATSVVDPHDFALSQIFEA
jgi:hypothetical protein